MSTADGERALLRDTVERLLARHCTPERIAAAAEAGWDAMLWRALEDTGLTLAGSPEAGGDLAAAADVAVAAGAAAAPVPLAETLAAGMLLARAGLPIPTGPLTMAVAAGRGAALRRVPYGRLATTVAAGADEDGDWLAVLAGPTRVQRGRNLAGEPRDEVEPDADAEVRAVPAGTADYARRLLLLFRSLLIAGAAQRALELTVTYVQEREQFGRPLAKFPTVQQELARMAGEVALVSAATQAAVAAEAAEAEATGAGATAAEAAEAGATAAEASGAGATAAEASGAGATGAEATGAAGAEATAAEGARAEPSGRGTISAVLAAKAQASESAGIVAAIAHQLHGAIGTTEEHRLRLTTTRLWSWRDEDGPASECFAELGRAALRAGAGGLWPWLID